MMSIFPEAVVTENKSEMEDVPYDRWAIFQGAVFCHQHLHVQGMKEDGLSIRALKCKNAQTLKTVLKIKVK
jgi:hypothetical protein